MTGQHKHVWKRLFKTPDAKDTGSRLSYLLGKRDRYFGCTECPAVGNKAKFSGVIYPISDSGAAERREQAAEWEDILKSRGKTA